MLISEKVAKAILDQTSREQTASNLYFSISLRMANLGLPHCAAWFEKASAEEIEHRNKMLAFLADMACPCDMGQPKIVDKIADDCPSAFAQALDLEISVTEYINKIANLIMSEQDWLSWAFWRFFIEEQLDSVRDLTNLVARTKNCDSNWLEFDESLEG